MKNAIALQGLMSETGTRRFMIGTPSQSHRAMVSETKQHSSQGAILYNSATGSLTLKTVSLLSSAPSSVNIDRTCTTHGLCMLAHGIDDAPQDNKATIHARPSPEHCLPPRAGEMAHRTERDNPLCLWIAAAKHLSQLWSG